MVPTLAHGLICALRMADRGTKDFIKDFMFFAISFAVGVLLMVISCFLFVHWIDGLIFLGALVVMVYIAAQLWLYYSNNFYMKPIWALVNQTIVVLCVLFAFIWSAFDKELTSYEGGSYSASVLLFFIWCYAASSYFLDFYQGDERPVYFSTSLFPVY